MGLLISTGYQVPMLLPWEECSAPEASLLFATAWKFESPLAAFTSTNRTPQ